MAHTEPPQTPRAPKRTEHLHLAWDFWSGFGFSEMKCAEISGNNLRSKCEGNLNLRLAGNPSHCPETNTKLYRQSLLIRRFFRAVLTMQRACRHRSAMQTYVILTASTRALQITRSSDTMQQCSSEWVSSYYQWVPNIDVNIYKYHSAQNIWEISPWSWPAKTWASSPFGTPRACAKRAKGGYTDISVYGERLFKAFLSNFCIRYRLRSTCWTAILHAAPGIWNYLFHNVRHAVCLLIGGIRESSYKCGDLLQLVLLQVLCIFMYILVSVVFVLLMLSLKSFPIHTRCSTNPTTFKSFEINCYAFVTVVVITIIIIIIIPDSSIRMNFIEFGTKFPAPSRPLWSPSTLLPSVPGALSCNITTLEWSCCLISI